MKKAAALVAIVLAVGMTAAWDAEAKRLGGGKSGGMQRQATTDVARPAPGTPAAQQVPAAAGAAAAAPAAAAAQGGRSWMGPVAGIAAGLGIAALASHLGFGPALANILTVALLAMAVVLVVGFFLRKRGLAGRPAVAGVPGGDRFGAQRTSAAPVRTGSLIGSGIGSGLGGGLPAASGAIPADFDVAGFVRNAKANFEDLQAANDAADLARLRDYLAPELFEEVRAEVQARGATAQKTEFYGLEATVLEVVEEPQRYIVSVRFTGAVREEAGAEPVDLDEVWHLTKPRHGGGGWVVAGIQQAPAAQ